MIIIAERGQFGNQLWQFNYSLAKREGSEKIFLIGFDELSRIIKKEKNIFFISRNNFFSKILLLFPGFVSKILFKTRLFKCIYEDNLNNIKENYPIFKNIKFILGFFQRENLLYKDIKNKLIQNSRYKSKAVNLIKKKDLLTKKFFLFILD